MVRPTLLKTWGGDRSDDDDDTDDDDNDDERVGCRAWAVDIHAASI